MQTIKKKYRPARYVSEDYHGQRLDNYLAREMKGAPRALIYKLIRTGQVRINGKRAAAKDKLCGGDFLRIPDNVSLTAPAVVKAQTLPILFEDENLLGVNKPSGMATHGGSGIVGGVIEKLRATNQYRFLELAHRLDKGTSGVLLLAKKSSALKRLQEIWRARRVKKTYQAIVFGVWNKNFGAIDLPIKRIAHGIGSVIDDDGREALTRTKLTRQFDTAALLEADITTGRTHQLRVHLAAVGLPIVGDTKYGDFAANRRYKNCNRLFLHASRLSFPHPITEEKITITADLPNDFIYFQQQLQ